MDTVQHNIEKEKKWAPTKKKLISEKKKEN